MISNGDTGQMKAYTWSSFKTVEGPYPHGDRFILHFKYDVTPKHTGKRVTVDETGLYAIHNGKITKEEFFHSV
jgi:hypothetical protein